MPVSPYARLTRRVLRLLGAAGAGLPLPAHRAAGPVLVQRAAERSGLPVPGPRRSTGTRRRSTNRMLIDAVVELHRRSRSLVAVLATIIGTMAAFALVRGGVRFPSGVRVVGHDAHHAAGHPAGHRHPHLPAPRARPAAVAADGRGRATCVFTMPFVILIVAARLPGLRRRPRVGGGRPGRRARRTRAAHVILPLICAGHPRLARSSA